MSSKAAKGQAEKKPTASPTSSTETPAPESIDVDEDATNAIHVEAPLQGSATEQTASSSHASNTPETNESGDSNPEPGRPGIHADQGPTRVEGLARCDALDRGRITKALVQLIASRSDVAPIAIGLFGHWGSGKSSQIDFVKKALSELAQPRTRIAEFNAWHHEKTDNLGAALAQTVVEALVRDLGFLDQLKLSVRLATRRKSRLTASLSKDTRGFSAWLYRWTTILAPLLGPALMVALATFVALTSFQWAALDAVKTWVGTFTTGAAALWFGWHKFVASNLTQWFKRISIQHRGGVLSLPDFSSKLGSFHEIHTTLKHLCALQLSGADDAPTNGDYLFLVIDDLDRCTPLAVKQVFDAVRLVASIPRVVTLVAIDDRIAFAAVATHYEQFSFAGREPSQVARDYLAKIFQVAITLPPVGSAISGRFIHTELFATELNGVPPTLSTNSSFAADLKAEAASARSGVLHDYRSALPEEVALFALLANETAMSNPRELWRLKQAWFLLKGMVLEDGNGMAEMEPWMRSLFVREWELQAAEAMRHRIKRQVEATRIGFDIDELDADTKKILAMEMDNYLARRPFVDAVLLPSAPTNPVGAPRADVALAG